jgi:hypothetical protein
MKAFHRCNKNARASALVVCRGIHFRSCPDILTRHYLYKLATDR